MKKTGDEYFDSEEFRDMLHEYEEALASGMPVFLDADELSEIADYYQMTEQPDKANRAIDTALELAPGAIGPLTYKIHEALWEGDVELARSYLDQITETSEPDYVYDTAEILLAEEQPDDADRYLRQEMHKVPKEEMQDYIIDVANIFADYDYPEMAMKWMSRARQEESPEFKELMARTLFGLGKYKDSERIWGELIDHDPFSKYYWNALASAQMMNEDFSGSVESSEYAIAIDPDDPEALLSKANALFRLYNYEEALKYFERYADRMPDDELGPFNQALCLVNLDRTDEAALLLRKAADMAPEDSPYLADIYQEMAFAASDSCKANEAMEFLDKADAAGADKVQTLIVRGHVMLDAGNMGEAEKYFQQAIVNSDNPNDTLLQVIVSIYDNHYVDAAYSLFCRYFKIVPPDGDKGYAYMALCCYDLKRWDEFLAYLKTACQRNPRECEVALAHLFPEGLQPEKYYDYIKERMAK